MKKILIALLLLSQAAFAGNKIAALSSIGSSPFTPPVLKAMTLSNGIKLYLFEDKSLPMIQGKLFLKGGSVFEKEGAVGAGSVMTNLLKEGGTATKKPSEIRSMLDENAIDITFGISPESIEGYFGSLSKDSSKALHIFFEMMFEPAFDEESFATSKKRIIDAIKRDEDRSTPVAAKKFRSAVYGASDPWGRPTEVADIKGLKRSDVVDFYGRFFSPDRMILAIVGDFERPELLKELEALAKKYPAKELPPEDLPKADIIEGASEEFVKRDFTQSALDIGHAGSTRNNPDKFSLVIMNDVFGGSGSFSDRLKQSVRVKGGLAYEVWSSYGFGPEGAPGIFMIHAKTRNKTVDKTIELIRSELSAFVEKGAMEEELQRSKKSILNSMIFEYENPFGMAAAVARFVHYGYPKNYIEIYKRGIERVSLKDVNEAAKKYLHPDQLKIVVVGN